jgi:hypothetical protein
LLDEGQQYLIALTLHQLAGGQISLRRNGLANRSMTGCAVLLVKIDSVQLSLPLLAEAGRELSPPQALNSNARTRIPIAVPALNNRL